MIAYIVEWGWFKIGSYGVMMALGFLTAWALFRSELARKGLPTDLASRITFNAAIWGVIGARVLSILEEPGRFSHEPFRMLVLEGGLTWYGGLLAGTLATIWTIHQSKAPFLRVFDAMSPAAVVGYGFGRGGCLFSGDGCYGMPTDLPWGMAFPQLEAGPGFHCLQGGAIAPWPPHDPITHRPYAADVLVHPTPLYEILACLAIFAVLWLLRKRIARTGAMLGLFFLTTAVPRFLVEFIRLNDRYAGLSLSQWVAIGSAGLGGWLIWNSRSLPLPGTEPEPAHAERPAGRRRRRK